jgi:hypothetical protein
MWRCKFEQGELSVYHTLSGGNLESDNGNSSYDTYIIDFHKFNMNFIVAYDTISKNPQCDAMHSKPLH